MIVWHVHLTNGCSLIDLLLQDVLMMKQKRPAQKNCCIAGKSSVLREFDLQKDKMQYLLPGPIANQTKSLIGIHSHIRGGTHEPKSKS